MGGGGEKRSSLSICPFPAAHHKHFTFEDLLAYLSTSMSVSGITESTGMTNHVCYVSLIHSLPINLCQKEEQPKVLSDLVRQNKDKENPSPCQAV